jgi:hypothetical protein
VIEGEGRVPKRQLCVGVTYGIVKDGVLWPFTFAGTNLTKMRYHTGSILTKGRQAAARLARKGKRRLNLWRCRFRTDTKM